MSKPVPLKKKQQFAKALRAFRDARKLDREDLEVSSLNGIKEKASTLVTIHAIVSWENATRYPEWGSINSIAAKLGMPVDEFARAVGWQP